MTESRHSEPPANQSERLTAYLDGESDDATADAVEADLDRDPNLRQDLDTLQRAWDMLDFLPGPQTKPDFARRTAELARASMAATVAERSVPKRWPSARIWWASVVGVFVIAVLLARRQPNSDQALIRERPLLERLDTYQAVQDVQFLDRLEDEGLLVQMDQLLEPSP